MSKDTNVRNARRFMLFETKTRQIAISVLCFVHEVALIHLTVVFSSYLPVDQQYGKFCNSTINLTVLFV